MKGRREHDRELKGVSRKARSRVVSSGNQDGGGERKLRNKLKFLAYMGMAVFLIAMSPPEGLEKYVIEGFSGIVSDRAPTNNLAYARELVNADIIIRGDRAILKQRSGYVKLGGNSLEDYPVAGIFRYNPIGASHEILVASGKNLYGYDRANDTLKITGTNPLAGVCTTTSSNDTIKGINTSWWDHSHRAYTYMRFTATDSTPIKAILTNNRIVLTQDTIHTNNAFACTLAGNDAIAVEGGEVFDDAIAPKRWVQFMDTVIITSANKRVKYSSATTPPPAMRTITWGSWTPSYSYVFLHGDYISDLQQGNWVQVHCPTVSGGKRYRNLAFNIKGIMGGTRLDVFMDTLTFAALASNVDSNWQYRKIATPTWTVVAQCTLNDLGDGTTVDSLYLDLFSTYRYWVDIDSTSVVGFPSIWPIDSLDYMTVTYARSCTTGATKYEIPVSMNSAGEIRLTGGVGGWGTVFRAGDSLILFKMDRITPAIADTALHEDWYYPLVGLLNNKLYWSGNDDYPSEIWSFEEFILDSNANYNNVFINRDDGDVITVIVPYYRNLITFKTRSVYLCVISPYDNTIDEVIRVDSPVGAPSQEAVVEHNGLIYFCAPPFGVFTYNGSRVQNISAPVNYYFADSVEVGTETSIRVIVYHDPTIGTPGLYVSYTHLGGTQNNRTLRYDLTTGQWSKYYNFAGSAFGVMRGGTGYGDTLLIGTPAIGNSYLLKFPSGTKDTGQYVETSFLSGFNTFGSALSNKAWSKNVPIIHATANDSVRIYWYEDWLSTATHVDSFALSAGWQAPRRHIKNVQGKSLGFKIESKDAEEFEVAGIEIYYQDKGEADD